MSLAAPRLDVPCVAYCQDEQAWYHGIIGNVESSFIEVREVETYEFKVVMLPLLNRKYFRYLDDNEEESKYKVGDAVEVYWDEEEEWYKGEVDRVSDEKGVHVSYDDGGKAWISWEQLREEGEELMRVVEDEVKERKGTKRKASDALHECGILGCSFKAKTAGHLRRHQANIHGVNVIYYECKEEGCEYKAKQGGDLKQHLANMHDIGVVWHKCDHKGCSFKAKTASNLRGHQASIHGVNIIYHECKEEGCEYKAKQAENLKRHLTNMHDIGVVWHKCDHKG